MRLFFLILVWFWKNRKLGRQVFLRKMSRTAARTKKKERRKTAPPWRVGVEWSGWPFLLGLGVASPFLGVGLIFLFGVGVGVVNIPSQVRATPREKEK